MFQFHMESEQLHYYLLYLELHFLLKFQVNSNLLLQNHKMFDWLIPDKFLLHMVFG